ncbi:MAG: hypothetical protein LBN39_12350, partial [Planctomycetaceae bacterium]|nr:hypothetical protein [Planctomycetaceae bacterium]
FLAPDEHIKVLGPPAQRFWGTEQAKGLFESPEENIEEVLPAIFAAVSNPDAVPKINHYEKDWTETDFLDWVGRTTWTLKEPTSLHESTALGCGAELPDLYQAAMFILRNGSVQMAGDVPLMTYPVNRRLYWLEMSYCLVNRTLDGDLKVYQ